MMSPIRYRLIIVRGHIILHHNHIKPPHQFVMPPLINHSMFMTAGHHQIMKVPQKFTMFPYVHLHFIYNTHSMFLMAPSKIVIAPL